MLMRLLRLDMVIKGDVGRGGGGCGCVGEAAVAAAASLVGEVLGLEVGG